MLWNPLEIARLSKSCRQKTISEKRKCLVLWCVYSYRCPYCCKEERCVVLLGRGGCWCRLFGTADCCQKTRSTETGTYENIFLPPLNFSVPSERGVRRRVWKHFCAGSMFLGPLRTRSTETGTYENSFVPALMFLGPLRFSSSAFLSLQFLWIIPIVFYFCFCFPVFWFIFVACTCYLVEMSSAVPVRLPSQTVVC